MAAGTSVVDIDPAPTGALGGPRAPCCASPPRPAATDPFSQSMLRYLSIDRRRRCLPARTAKSIARLIDLISVLP